MKKLITGSRVLLGMVFVVFGLNGFFRFIPVPPLAPAAASFLGALIGTGYLMVLVKTMEVVGGALLLANRYAPAATVLLAPIVVNIFLFHLFLDRAGMPMAILVAVLWATLVWAYRHVYRALCVRRG